jgi:hypothetical protein
VSAEAISWALNLAPVPAGRGAAVHRVQVRARRPGQPRMAGRHRRIPLSGHAGQLHRAVGADGTHLPGPAAATEGIISRCDPNIVAARIKRVDRRPQGWDLNLSLVRDYLGAAAAVLDHQFPRLGSRLAVSKAGQQARSVCAARH